MQAFFSHLNELIGKNYFPTYNEMDKARKIKMNAFEIKMLESREGYCMSFENALDIFYGCPEIRPYVIIFIFDLKI